jgi:sulfide:quinone oxidoreductase
MAQETPHRVVVAGGGVAGLEAVMALHDLAGDRVEVTLAGPDDEFWLQALSVGEPFGSTPPRRYGVAEICAAHGAAFVRAAVQGVDVEARTVRVSSAEELPFDSLLLALGARPHAAYPEAVTFRGHQDVEALRAVVDEVDSGAAASIAFVVPVGVTWPLPLYELALLVAEHASARGVGVELTVVTPEGEPLSVFGRPVRAAVAEALESAGVRLLPSTQVHDVDAGEVLGRSEAVVVRADRVVALPLLAARRVPGIPTDAEGFLPTDEHGAVAGAPGVFAAGDGTTFPIKQGGIAAQQADAAARAIAARAGADVEPRPFRPTLRAKLLAGTHATYLRDALRGSSEHDAPTVSDHTLWWPPSKLAAPYLAAYLDRADAGAPVAGPLAHGPASIHATGDPGGGIDALET